MRRHRPVRLRTGAPAVGLLACLCAVTALTGCDSGAGRSGPAAGAEARPPVIAPGRPGETAGTLSPEEAVKAAGADTGPNAADFRYVRRMIPHHRQALVMTDLAEEHATAPGVRALASRIAGAQRPEIGAMRGWWKQNAPGSGDHGPEDAAPEDGRPAGKDGPDDGAHHGHGGSGGGADAGHGDMPGMASEADLARLRAARGTRFDALFLSLMTAHHEGAVKMAEDLLAGGNDVRVEDMATDVVVQQKAEISRMRDLA